MRIIFCSEPFRPGTPDAAFAGEYEAARDAGFEVSLIDYEALDEGRAAAAVRRVPPAESAAPALYRGWMLKPGRYAELHAALLSRGVSLLNSPAGYRAAHLLAEAYPVIAGHTARSVFVSPGEPAWDDDAALAERLSCFGDRPLFLRDWVKSRKHEWAEASFIPSASDLGAVRRVARRFLELQGEDLEGGLVFREYLELRRIGLHPVSGMPLSREYRLFFLDGELLASAPYWDGCAGDAGDPPDTFPEVARRVRSRFFSMDVGELAAGGWAVMETGDGGVTGLPEALTPADFYAALARRAPGGGAVC